MRSLVLVCVLASTAHADDLERGRALEAQGKHKDAIAAFEAFLKAHPDDAVANAELGWAAYQAKDYAKAEAATKQAIDKAPKPTFRHDPTGKTRGAALYNLGLIQLANGAAKDAASSWVESLQMRPSRVVREKLIALDANAAATVDPLAPVRLAGPFKSLDDACQDYLVKLGEDPKLTWGSDQSCSNFDRIKIDKVKLAPPFLEVVAYELLSRSDLEIGIRLADGWYAFEITFSGTHSQAHCGGTNFHVTVRPGKVPEPALQIEYTSQNDACFHKIRSWGWDERGYVVVGVGPSGKPAATPRIPRKLVDWDETDTSRKRTVTTASLTADWPASGKLVVTGTVVPATMPDDPDPEELIGTHAIRFP